MQTTWTTIDADDPSSNATPTLEGTSPLSSSVGGAPGPDADLVTVKISTDLWGKSDAECLHDRADRLIATGGLTYDEYRLLQCAGQDLEVVVLRLESAALLRLVCRCGRKIA